MLDAAVDCRELQDFLAPEGWKEIIDFCQQGWREWTSETCGPSSEPINSFAWRDCKTTRLFV